VIVQEEVCTPGGSYNPGQVKAERRQLSMLFLFTSAGLTESGYLALTSVKGFDNK
jgi:hypothetical protein